jgi:PBP1b-binding outer membrane lipoprotein LpoB
MRYTTIMITAIFLSACSYTFENDPAKPTVTIEPNDTMGDTVNEVINDARELDGEAIRDSVRFGISWPFNWFNRKD